MSVRPSVRLAGCPCKPCVQNAGRIFKDILIKFGTELWFGTGTIPIENGWDRPIISPSPHTSVPPEYAFKPLNSSALPVM